MSSKLHEFVTATYPEEHCIECVVVELLVVLCPDDGLSDHDRHDESEGQCGALPPPVDARLEGNSVDLHHPRRQHY